VLLLVLLAWERTAWTQELKSFEINSIAFDGNATVPSKELNSLVATKETPGFLNKLLYGISEKLGRKKEYFNPETLGSDLERLKQHYVNRGFSDAAIDTVLRFDEADSTVDILFKINEGYRSKIDTLVYRGLDGTPPQVALDLAQNPLIKQGDYFDSYLLVQEVSRVLGILSNNGYPNPAYVRDRDSSKATRYTSTKNYAVTLTFDHRKLYWFGDVHIRQDVDTLRGMLPRDDITDEIILRQLDYKPGDLYNADAKITSQQNLNRLGIFDLRRLDTPVPQRVDSSNYIQTFITIRPRDRHELAPELIVSDENGAFNLGTGIGYTHRNFLGGARTFTTRLRFRTQTLEEIPRYFDRNGKAIANLDLTFEMLQPYIFTNKIRGSWSFSYIVDKQKPYLQNIVKNIFGFNDRFAEFTTGSLEWSLESIALRYNDNFRVDSTDVVLLQQLRNIQPQQFNSVLSFTIQRDMSNDRFSPTGGFIHSATFEEAGLLPLAFEKAFPDLPFTQFYRVDFLGRWYYDLTTHRYAVFAIKLRGGGEGKYGLSHSDPNRGIPQTHRFFAGGSGSVRGWTSRGLIASGDPQLGGNLILEGSGEIRWNLLQSLHDGFWDKIWLVSFIDFGNLWSDVHELQGRDIAVAAGFGLRYDTFFGPFRLDWGFRVYNPAEIPSHQWITQRRLIGQTFKEAIFHFGIGQAF
jgi:outer membrane protein insertion porin family